MSLTCLSDNPLTKKSSLLPYFVFELCIPKWEKILAKKANEKPLLIFLLRRAQRYDTPIFTVIYSIKGPIDWRHLYRMGNYIEVTITAWELPQVIRDFDYCVTKISSEKSFHVKNMDCNLLHLECRKWWQGKYKIIEKHRHRI